MQPVTPLVSIIMPAYNSEKYISVAINSILNQIYENWELVIIDDCSSDSTKLIVEHYVRSDGRIQYVKNANNIGSAGSRDLGISKATGEWIAFLDSDDYWPPEKLAKQIAFGYKNNAEFTFTGSNFMDEKGNHLNNYLTVPNKVSFKGLLKQNIISCSSVMINRTLISSFSMEAPLGVHEDFALWLKILKNTNSYAYGLDFPLLVYRVNRNSKSGNKLKSAFMTLRVYRYIGLPLHKCLICWLFYIVKSLAKYTRLYDKH